MSSQLQKQAQRDDLCLNNTCSKFTFTYIQTNCQRYGCNFWHDNTNKWYDILVVNTILILKICHPGIATFLQIRSQKPSLNVINESSLVALYRG